MATVEVYNGPGTELYRSPFYSVSADVSGVYSSVYVYHASAEAWADGGGTTPPRNQYWTSGSYPVMNYFTIGVETSTTLKIKNLTGSISSVDIGPYKLNKQYSISGDTVTFDINKNENLFIFINNQTSCPIMPFANPPKPPIPSPYVDYSALGSWTTEQCIYFGPGVHSPGFNFSSYDSKLLSSVQLYFDGGAYVKGSLMLVSSNNVSTVGPGILSCEDWYSTALTDLRSTTGTGSVWQRMLSGLYFPITARFTYAATSTGLGVWGHYNTNLPSGIYVDGITIVKFPAHGPKGLNTSKNLKLISPWEFSTDGPSLIPDKSFSPPISRHENLFIINADDCVYMGAEHYFGNIVYSSCYFINSNNGPFASYGVTFDSSRIYGSSSFDISVRQFDSPKTNNGNLGLFKLTMGGNNATAYPPNWNRQNVFFSGVYFEGFNYTTPFYFANRTDPFAETPALYLSGAASGFTFKDIWISGAASSMSSCYFSGLDEVNESSDFLFHNVTLNGVKVTEANKDSYFTFSGSIDPSTDNIRFTADFNTNMKVSPIKLLN